MKTASFLFMLTFLIACDPYGFGFKKNPAFILNEAFDSIQNLDLESFLEVSGKEALCVYGNDRGVMYLKENLVINTEDIKLNPKIISSKYFETNPQFVNYWSYYTERYEVDVIRKREKDVVLKAIIDCDYGTDGEKDKKLLMLDKKKYKKKECRLSKIIPVNFSPMIITKKCEMLKISL